jgi:hypothetical protein
VTLPQVQVVRHSPLSVAVGERCGLWKTLFSDYFFRVPDPLPAAPRHAHLFGETVLCVYVCMCMYVCMCVCVGGGLRGWGWVVRMMSEWNVRSVSVRCFVLLFLCYSVTVRHLF